VALFADPPVFPGASGSEKHATIQLAPQKEGSLIDRLSAATTGSDTGLVFQVALEGVQYQTQLQEQQKQAEETRRREQEREKERQEREKERQEVHPIAF
jgi:cell division protein FtsN